MVNPKRAIVQEYQSTSSKNLTFCIKISLFISIIAVGISCFLTSLDIVSVYLTNFFMLNIGKLKFHRF
ncbi:hypothetical protein JCM12294_48900 [Desulfocicer niacini]